jgi:MGT family glycosyltransferase
MATIAMLIDREEGHLLSSFWLSRKLKDYGFRVCYLVGGADSEAFVRSQGFEFIALPTIAFSQDSHNRHPAVRNSGFGYFGPLVRGEVLDEAINALRPDVILILSLYYTAGLAIHYRYKVPVVFFTPSLRKSTRANDCMGVIDDLMHFGSAISELLDLLTKSQIHFSNFKDIAQLVLGFPELVLLPEAFDLPGRGNEPEVYYVGAGVDLARKEESYPWASIDSSLPLIYCAYGSQSQLQKNAGQRFFQTAFAAATTRPDWQFIVATGSWLETENFPDVPPNVTLSKWVPQLEVLSRADLMITHGGFNTVKECILMGAPMIALPSKNFRDHFSSAERVVYHGLGLQRDIAEVSSTELISLIDQILNDQSFKLRVDLMREKFLQQDRFDIAIKVIENSISGKYCASK